MRNTDIKDLKQVVPANIRLQVYKEALEYYENKGYAEEDFIEGNYGDGLCLVLPCILWGLKHYLDFTFEWDYHYTPIAFPELDREALGVLAYRGHIDIFPIRIKYLETWIEKLEHELRN